MHRRNFLNAAGAAYLAAAGAPRTFAAQAAAGKAEALLKQMTLDEKIGQMVQADYMAMKDLGDVAKYFLGSVLCGGGSDPSPDNLPESWAKANDDCQAESQKTRLKIPLLFGIDAVHGHNNVQGATIFPHNIGIGATRNPKLVEEAGRVAAREIVGTGMRWAFAPCVAVGQDERWGRTYESFSEDPKLVGELGAAYVRGLQGAKLSADPFSVLACPKHFLGDGGTTKGKDQGNTEVDEKTLREIHLAPYRDAVAAGAGSIMVSYSSWNGQKLHGHKQLLTDVLKGELKFDGFLVSDWAGIDQLDKNFLTCIERSINAGLDMIMIPNGPGSKPPGPNAPVSTNTYIAFIDGLKKLVADGKVAHERIDDAVLRILKVKSRMGLLDKAPLGTDAAAMKAIGSPAHREVARRCVRESLVLLKNDKNVLPLGPDKKELLVIGPAANDLGMQCGGWTIDWQGKSGAVTTGGTTILDALSSGAASGMARACIYSSNGSYDPHFQGRFQAAIVVLGEKPYAEMFGDRADLSLTEEDLELIRIARGSNAPVITVLLSGRPRILGKALELSDAFVAAFLPGTEGAGVADLLLGAVPFTGKLPVTWPKSMDQIPINKGDTNKGEPLFPFGHGLATKAK
jgi:beta-glucosidase